MTRIEREALLGDAIEYVDQDPWSNEVALSDYLTQALEEVGCVRHPLKHEFNERCSASAYVFEGNVVAVVSTWYEHPRDEESEREHVLEIDRTFVQTWCGKLRELALPRYIALCVENAEVEAEVFGSDVERERLRMTQRCTRMFNELLAQ